MKLCHQKIFPEFIFVFKWPFNFAECTQKFRNFGTDFLNFCENYLQCQTSASRAKKF